MVIGIACEGKKKRKRVMMEKDNSQEYFISASLDVISALILHKMTNQKQKKVVGYAKSVVSSTFTCWKCYSMDGDVWLL